MKQEVSVKAQNIYADWKKSVRKSQKSIRVITPYFDRSLIDLVKTSISANKTVQVLTDVDTPNWIEALAQLKAAIKLIKMGVEVRSLKGLHAKVLLIDGAIKTVGSQNFTRRGKVNSEVSMLLSDGELRAEKKLEEWWDSSREVFAEDLYEILAELEPKLEELERLAELLQSSLNKKKASLDKIRYLNRLEKIRLKAENSSIIVNDEVNDIAYLEAKDNGLYVYDSQLIFWKDGQKIKRLFFYPVFFFNRNRLAFCRVAKTRIRYLSDSVRWSGTNIPIGQSFIYEYEVTCSCGEKGAQIEFKSNLGDLKILFNDGELDFKISDLKSEISIAFSEEQKAKSIIAGLVFGDFKFERMNHMSIDKETSAEYFEVEEFYEVRVIEVYGHPILVLNKY